MYLSIVATMYKSGEYIEEFCTRAALEAQKITDDYEIILVNDGCPKDSLQRALELHSKDQRIKVVNLSRNFGHHIAMMTGLKFAKGDYVFLIDIDLEEEPELLGVFWNEMCSEKDLDVVFGVQKKRKGGLFEKLSGQVFFKILNRLSDVHIPVNICTVRLMKRNYVQALLKFEERAIVIAGLWVLTGFVQKQVEINKLSTGNSTYNLSRKISLAVNFISSLSSKPLNMIFYMGLGITSFSFLMVIILLFNKLVSGDVMSGWTSILITIWMTSGLIIFSIGILGIYISKIFIEVKQRPYSIVKDYYGDEI